MTQQKRCRSQSCVCPHIQSSWLFIATFVHIASAQTPRGDYIGCFVDKIILRDLPHTGPTIAMPPYGDIARKADLLRVIPKDMAAKLHMDVPDMDAVSHGDLQKRITNYVRAMTSDHKISLGALEDTEKQEAEKGTDKDDK